MADVASFRASRSGAIRTYLDAKSAFAREHEAIEHHLLVTSAHGYRLPLRSRGIVARLEAAQPDVVLLHDPFWGAREVCRLAHANGAAVVLVVHRSARLDAGMWPTPTKLCARALRRWRRGVYQGVDAVMVAGDPWVDTGRRSAIALRCGLHPAFRPQPDVARGDHVLVAGHVGRETEILTLVEAAARSSQGWPVRVAGGGPAVAHVRAHARRLGVEQRLQLPTRVEGDRALARAFASASCVVIPAADETSLGAARQAAACATPVVTCETAPAGAAIREGSIMFRPGDAEDLLVAIERARRERPSHTAAATFARAHTWERALSAELRDLKALAGW